MIGGANHPLALGTEQEGGRFQKSRSICSCLAFDSSCPTPKVVYACMNTSHRGSTLFQADSGSIGALAYDWRVEGGGRHMVLTKQSPERALLSLVHTRATRRGQREDLFFRMVSSCSLHETGRITMGRQRSTTHRGCDEARRAHTGQGLDVAVHGSSKRAELERKQWSGPGNMRPYLQLRWSVEVGMQGRTRRIHRVASRALKQLQVRPPDLHAGLACPNRHLLLHPCTSCRTEGATPDSF